MHLDRLLEPKPESTPAVMIGADEELSASAEDQVARLAYSYWEARGNQGGSPWEDWFRAEEELKRRAEL